MKKVFTLISAMSVAVASFAYDSATDGEIYFGSGCQAYGLADGTVAITTYYLDTENPTTDITLPATIQVLSEDKTTVTAEYAVSQVGYSSWNNLWVSDGSDSNALPTITSITLSEGIKTINTNAFGWMSSPALKTVTLPSTLTLIKAGAFASCDSLTSIVCNAATAPTLDSSEGWTDHFKGASAWDQIANNCKISVPNETAQASYNQDPWTYWTVFYDASGVVVVEPTGLQSTLSPADADAPAYNLAGQRAADSARGIKVSNGRKVLVK